MQPERRNLWLKVPSLGLFAVCNTMVLEALQYSNELPEGHVLQMRGGELRLEGDQDTMTQTTNVMERWSM